MKSCGSTLHAEQADAPDEGVAEAPAGATPRLDCGVDEGGSDAQGEGRDKHAAQQPWSERLQEDVPERPGVGPTGSARKYFGTQQLVLKSGAPRYIGCSQIIERGRGGSVARALASHHGVPGSIPGGFAPGFSHAGIVLGDASCRRVFSERCRFPRSRISAPFNPGVSFRAASKDDGHLRLRLHEVEEFPGMRTSAGLQKSAKYNSEWIIVEFSKRHVAGCRRAEC
ncbi:hypothetical protein PR048_006831 [Dryococelus australis]|uniref:Uncharacterized protein n=1 Tax=Dryococelus australis TaxID=614101 RepID=A0ABQ9IDA6_9NEOP|nr:hypothetical protein PR048_006831 [Dryococelus australis]